MVLSCRWERWMAVQAGRRGGKGWARADNKGL